MVLGNGKRIRFWEDTWCGGLPLSEAFPALYNIASSKEAMISDIWVLSGDQGAWDPKFERPFNDWELETVQTFIGQINNRFTILQVQDKLIWKGNVSKVFTVTDYFNSLEEGPSCAAPIKILWNPHIPSKIGFFVWEAWWGKVLTSSQLKKRGFHLASKCLFYGKKEEELEHILIHCPPIWG